VIKGETMNAISKSIAKRKAEQRARDQTIVIWNSAQKYMYLRWMHFLRFHPSTRFCKRLEKLHKDFYENSERDFELMGDSVMTAKYRKELEDSGVDLGDDFYASLEAFEQALYEHTRDKEHGKRRAGK
jgi:hypothetical protein